MIHLLKRTVKITFRLTPQEAAAFRLRVKSSGLSQEAYIRQLLSGYLPKPAPPLDYHRMIKSLTAIGSNINQIAVRAHTYGELHTDWLRAELDKLGTAIFDIQQAIVGPERM